MKLLLFLLLCLTGALLQTFPDATNTGYAAAGYTLQNIAAGIVSDIYAPPDPLPSYTVVQSDGWVLLRGLRLSGSFQVRITFQPLGRLPLLMISLRYIVITSLYVGVK